MKVIALKKGSKTYAVMQIPVDGKKQLMAFSQGEIDNALIRAMKWKKEIQMKELV